MRGIVLFAHGARDPEWARPFEEIRDRVRASRPEYPIELAYLEMMEPTLDAAIESLCREGASSITVFPLFLAQGAHLKQDVPRIPMFHSNPPTAASKKVTGFLPHPTGGESFVMVSLATK